MFRGFLREDHAPIPMWKQSAFVDRTTAPGALGVVPLKLCPIWRKYRKPSIRLRMIRVSHSWASIGDSGGKLVGLGGSESLPATVLGVELHAGKRR